VTDYLGRRYSQDHNDPQPASRIRSRVPGDPRAEPARSAPCHCRPGLDVKQVQESVRSRERGSLECVTLHTHLRLNPFDIAEAAPCRGARISGGHAVLLVLPDAHLQMEIDLVLNFRFDMKQSQRASMITPRWSTEGVARSASRRPNSGRSHERSACVLHHNGSPTQDRWRRSAGRLVHDFERSPPRRSSGYVPTGGPFDWWAARRS
jgi:hypothetical protein